MKLFILALLFAGALAQDNCSTLGQNVGQCFSDAWQNCDSGNCGKYDLTIEDVTCDEMTSILCGAGMPDCCCGSDVIAVSECNFAQHYGTECKVDCSTVQDTTNSDTGSSNQDDNSATCEQLGQNVGTCFQDWEKCSGNNCNNYNIPDTANCAQMTAILCSAGIPDCCCGSDIVAVSECNFKQNNNGEECKVDCATLSSNLASGQTVVGAASPVSDDTSTASTLKMPVAILMGLFM